MITKAVREAAALLCQMTACASAAGYASGGQVDPIEEEPDGPVLTLAIAAFGAVPWRGTIFADEWAEAESWLRTGWTPEK